MPAHSQKDLSLGEVDMSKRKLDDDDEAVAEAEQRRSGMYTANLSPADILPQ